MLSIEKRRTEFEELDMSEHALPGSTGWSLMARAVRPSKISGGVIADAIGAGKTVISISIILSGLKDSRNHGRLPNQSSATLVVVPPGLIDQWESEIEKFTDDLKVIKIYDLDALQKIRVKDMIHADCVICPVDILEAKGYLMNLIQKTGAAKDLKECPELPTRTGQIEKNGADGIWIPTSSQDPYGGANNPNNQRRRNASAYFTFMYLQMVQKLRGKKFRDTEQGMPLEFFEWERIFVDEIHESLCTTKQELGMAKEATADSDSGFFKEKNRRAGRELLGITMKDISKRPLVYRKAIFGLTGTPLLDSSNRVTELANLMGNTYIIGLSSHWRKLERESGRDIFLQNFLEPAQSREIRKNIYSKCQEYLDVACCRNKSEKEMMGITLMEHREAVHMTEEEMSAYKKSQSGIAPDKQSLAIKPEDFDSSAGHDISKFLRQNAKLRSRGDALVKVSGIVLCLSSSS